MSRLYARRTYGHLFVMDIRAWRISGIVVSGVLIGGAIAIAVTLQPAVRRTAQPPPSTAHAEHRPTPIAFAMSLRGDGPLARAQRLAMRGGRQSAARRQAERALARQSAFRGLCFERFTARGDIVVRACRDGTSERDWQARLRAMPAVTHVDAIGQLTQDEGGD